MRGKGKAVFLLMAAVFVMAGIIGNAEDISAKTVKVKAAGKQVKVGATIALKTKTKGVSYKSSDATIASVNKSGVVTGKKAGKVKITVKKSGYQPKEITLKVKAQKGKPSLDVALDEVMLQSPKMKRLSDGSYQYSAVIKNTAKKGKVIQIQYHYQINVADSTDGTSAEQADATDSVSVVTQNVVLTAKNIKPGKKSSRVSCIGDISGKIKSMHLTKVVLYTGDAMYTYQVSSGKGSLAWSDTDLTGPEITGWVGKNSVYNGEPVWICYTDRKGTYNFKENVKAVDARDGKVSVSVDTSKINWKKEGIYKIYYTAKDKSGNQTKTWAKVRVYKPGTAERIADIILSTSIKSGSDVQKLRSIYSYVQSHCSYTGNGSHTNWRATAVKGIRNHSGDCFTYYAISKLLITRAGFHNITIRRYPSNPGNDHWWNLVYVKGGWYHFDTTPRSRKGYFCLQTDAQLHIYSTGSTFRFREELYPKRATKKISRNPV